MQQDKDLINQMLSFLSGKSNQFQSIYIQKDIISMLSKIPVCFQGFQLIKQLIFTYGMGVLLFIKPYYDKIKINDLGYCDLNLKQINNIVRDLLQQNNYVGFSQLSFFKFMDLTSPSPKKRRRKSRKTRIFNQIADSKLIDRSNKFRKHVLSLKSISNRIDQMKLRNCNTEDINLLSKCFEDLGNHERTIHDSMNYFQIQYHRYLLINIVKSLKKQADQFSVDNPLKNHIQKITTAILQSIKTGTILKSLKQVNSYKQKKISTKKQSVQYKNYCFKSESLEKGLTDRFCSRNQDQTQLITNLTQKKETDCRFLNPERQLAVEQQVQVRRMCCRTYFIQGEMIQYAESLQRQYKDYRFPLTNQHIEILRKTIVGFLNAMGGIIYMGIKQEQNRIRTVCSVKLNEREKQAFLFCVRNIVQSIQPQIITNKLYNIKFVPVRSAKNLALMAGRYVIKIIIDMGNPRELYTYINSEGYNVAFRTDNEVIGKDVKREFKKIYEIIKRRLLEPSRICEKQHQGKCQEPQRGLPSY